SDPDPYMQHDRWTRKLLEDYQARALQACREYAYAHSPFYQQFHQGLTDRPLQDLPVLTKAMLMEHFDDLVTDRPIHLEEVRQYLANPSGQERYLNRYRVMATSGSTGQPGVFLASQAEGATLTVGFTRFPAWAGVTPGSKVAIIASTASGHMSSQIPAMVHGQLLSRLQLSASDPVETLVQTLNKGQPDMLAGYASILRVLAEEQRQGRLHIAPGFIFSASETLTDETRQRIELAWHRRLFNIYAATECGVLAAECQYHRGLHLFEDLVIVEVVDEHNRPVPPGVFGDKVLLTVLFSRTQPLIRYEMSDRVSRSRMERCPCGRPFALLDGIQGRTPEVLHFPARTGGQVAVLPHVFHRVMDTLPVSEWQVVQERDRLQVLLSGAQAGLSEETLLEALQQALTEQGVVAPPIHIQQVAAIPRNATGKAPLIVSRHSRAEVQQPTKKESLS
ncbi:MAG: phenylacetate--CoA ligase family protein, partial [Chloroflexi bacterium]|nr:phenylacetate--CoA ligase family protein [Chloroflexota bacterium]